MNRLVRWFLVIASLSTVSCAHLGQDVRRVVACGEEAVVENVAKLGPAVNACLIRQDSTACLLALVDPARGITESLIACIVHQRGFEYGGALRANRGDKQSATAAKNAARFALDRGIVFAD